MYRSPELAQHIEQYLSRSDTPADIRRFGDRREDQRTARFESF